MPKPRAAKLETATARRKLPVRKKPFYVTVSPGIALGYRRNIGGRLVVRAVSPAKVRTGSSASGWPTILNPRTASTF